MEDFSHYRVPHTVISAKMPFIMYMSLKIILITFGVAKAALGTGHKGMDN